MSPHRGSLYGGTELTIMGLGFSMIPTENSVLLGKTFSLQGALLRFSLAKRICSRHWVVKQMLSMFFSIS